MLKRVCSIAFTLLLISTALPAAAAGGDDAGQPPDVFQNLKFRNLGPASARRPRLRSGRHPR